jgi:hypothetical protein
MTISSVKTGAIGDSLLAGNAAFNPSSFESIATATGTGSSGTITFSSIPSTYQHLQLRYIARNTASFTGPGDFRIQFNSDTGSNYAQHYLAGGGSSAFADGTSSGQMTFYSPLAHNNNASNILGAGIIDIHDYVSSTKNTTARAFMGVDFNDTNGVVSIQSGLWNNTAAVTSVSIIAANGSFNTQTVFSLYGIKGA